MLIDQQDTDWNSNGSNTKNAEQTKTLTQKYMVHQSLLRSQDIVYRWWDWGTYNIAKKNYYMVSLLYLISTLLLRKVALTGTGYR